VKNLRTLRNGLDASRYWLIVMSMLILTACASTPQREPEIQRISAEELDKLLPPPVAALSLDEIVQLSKQGLSAEDIIKKIQESKSQYVLTPSQYLDLNKQGVSTKVLDYIQSAHEQMLKENFADELNKREQAKVKEQEKLKKELLLRRGYPFYDPFWGPGPYWRHPFYGPGFYGPGSGLYYRFGW
jgi:hypothetical protein